MKQNKIFIVCQERIIDNEKDYIIKAFKHESDAKDCFNLMVDSVSALLNKASWKDEFVNDEHYYAYQEQDTISNNIEVFIKQITLK